MRLQGRAEPPGPPHSLAQLSLGNAGVWAQGPLPSSHRISIYSHKPELQLKATGVICCPKRPHCGNCLGKKMAIPYTIKMKPFCMGPEGSPEVQS